MSRPVKNGTERLTEEGFNAAAALIRMRTSLSREGARLVLVEGMTQTAASQKVGIKLSGVHDAVMSVRRAIVLAKIVAEGVIQCQ